VCARGSVYVRARMCVRACVCARARYIKRGTNQFIQTGVSSFIIRQCETKGQSVMCEINMFSDIVKECVLHSVRSTVKTIYLTSISRNNIVSRRIPEN